jgi:hypothetical protein
MATRQCELFLEFLQIQLDHWISNGQLVATYKALEEFGLDYRIIKQTIQESVYSGFVEKSLQGRGGAGSRFKLLKTPQPV